MKEIFNDHQQSRSHQQQIAQLVCQSLSCSPSFGPLSLPYPTVHSPPPHHCPYKQPALMVPILKLQIATTKVCVATDPAAQRLLT